MQIKLYMDGTQTRKTFTVPFVKARMLRRALEINDHMDGRKVDKETLSVDDLDEMVEFVVELFNNQFTVDELWDGLTNEEFISEIYRCILECIGGSKPKIQAKATDPNVRKRAK